MSKVVINRVIVDNWIGTTVVELDTHIASCDYVVVSPAIVTIGKNYARTTLLAKRVVVNVVVTHYVIVNVSMSRIVNVNSVPRIVIDFISLNKAILAAPIDTMTGPIRQIRITVMMDLVVEDFMRIGASCTAVAARTHDADTPCVLYFRVNDSSVVRRRHIIVVLNNIVLDGTRGAVKDQTINDNVVNRLIQP